MHIELSIKANWEFLCSKCRVLNHRLPDTVVDPTPLKKSGNNWQVISMSNIVHGMLNDMRRVFEENNGDLSCSEQVRE